MVDFLFVIIELLSLSLTVEMGESLWAQVSDGSECCPATTVGVRNLE